jgi:outer membrane immunogenic protein
MSRKALLGGVAAIAILAASAAVRPAIAEEAFDWSGLYIGGNFGGVAANYRGGKEIEGSSPIFADNLDLSGLAGGAHAGFNFQIDSFFGENQDLVIGLEGDAVFPDWEDTISIVTETTKGISGSVDLLASVRARLGLAFDNHLAYVTGGLAIPHADFSLFSSGGAFGKVDFNDLGGVVGGGLEIAVAESVSVRIEGLYYLIGDSKDVSGLPSAEASDFAEFKDAVVIRGGVTIHLGNL